MFGLGGALSHGGPDHGEAQDKEQTEQESEIGRLDLICGLQHARLSLPERAHEPV
jgi:hypothetical protein